MAAAYESHGHTHGVMDATIATTTRGIWAIKWSFAVLALTAAFQFVVVLAAGSVALLADMIHNVGDAVTAVPLRIAFMLGRRKPSARFTHGYGRAEDLAGVSIVLVILASAIVAVFRIRIGRQVNSAALIADGYHARTDGLTSLAVVIGAIGVYLSQTALAEPTSSMRFCGSSWQVDPRNWRFMWQNRPITIATDPAPGHPCCGLVGNRFYPVFRVGWEAST